MTSTRFNVASEISRRTRLLEPAAVMCVPARSHSASNSGLGEVVTVTTMSASRTAASALGAGTMSSPVVSFMRSQKLAMRSALRALT